MNKRSGDHDYALAFDTSTVRGDIALGHGAGVLGTQSLAGPRNHAVEFLPSVAALCKAHSVRPAEIRCVYVSIGPGSFTGLRIGLTTARMIALANGAAIAGVGTLEVIAQNAARLPDPPRRVAVVLDAKRKRVYAATFRWEDDHYAPDCAPAEVDPHDFLAKQDPGCAVLGEGVLHHQEAVHASRLTVLPESLFAPRAETVYRLGVFRYDAGALIDRRALTPLYIRPPEAEERWAQR